MLVVEVFNKQANAWVVSGSLPPGGPNGSMSNNNPAGTKELYVFQCLPDDKKSVLLRFTEFTARTSGDLRHAGLDPANAEVVAELRKGESYEITVRTDVAPEPRMIRFRHA